MPFQVCLVQPPNYAHALALREVAELLTCSLETLGQDCAFRANALDPEAVNIVLGYHLLSAPASESLPSRRLIFYQLEQLSEREGWFTPEREALLRSAWAVWDYSQENVAFLRDRGIRRVQHLPLGYHPRLERIRHRPEAQKDIDVLFYGSMNERRAAVIAELGRRGLRAECLFGVYGDARDACIARARIVLNVHFYQARILEQVRLSYLLNNRCFVISEEAGHNPFGDGVVTGPIEALPDLCAQYARCPQARQEAAARGHESFRQRPMVNYLRPVLGELNL
jgi:hypothetical protein